MYVCLFLIKFVLLQQHELKKSIRSSQYTHFSKILPASFFIDVIFINYMMPCWHKRIYVSKKSKPYCFYNDCTSYTELTRLPNEIEQVDCLMCAANEPVGCWCVSSLSALQCKCGLLRDLHQMQQYTEGRKVGVWRFRLSDSLWQQPLYF